MKTAAFSGQDFEDLQDYLPRIEQRIRMIIDYLYANGYRTILCGTRSRCEKLALRIIREWKDIEVITVTKRELYQCNYDQLVGIYPEYESVTNKSVLHHIPIINLYYTL